MTRTSRTCDGVSDVWDSCMIDEPECPGEDCPMCNGEVCEKCGAGKHTRVDEPKCEHDVIERHAEALKETRAELLDECGRLTRAIEALDPNESLTG